MSTLALPDLDKVYELFRSTPVPEGFNLGAKRLIESRSQPHWGNPGSESNLSQLNATPATSKKPSGTQCGFSTATGHELKPGARVKINTPGERVHEHTGTVLEEAGKNDIGDWKVELDDKKQFAVPFLFRNDEMFVFEDDAWFLKAGDKVKIKGTSYKGTVVKIDMEGVTVKHPHGTVMLYSHSSVELVESAEQKQCDCDFHKVIMVSGCQCGGV